MAKSLQEILGYVKLTGIIQATTSGTPNPLPAGFTNIKKPTVGNAGRYIQVNGSRQTARLVQYGSPALRRQLQNIASKDVKLIHTFEEMQIDVLVMEMLRNHTNPELMNRGIDEVTRQVKEFKVLFDNLRLTATLQTLSTGFIYFDGDGNLLPSSSGAKITIDYGVNSTTNGGQLQDAGGNTIITSWATASNDIPGMIRNIRKTALRRTGYPIRYAFYGENIPSYIAANNYVKDWFARNPHKQSQYLDTGELPDGMMGLTWIPAYDAFFEDSGNTNRDIWSADKVVFTPEPSPDWWETMEGTYSVPTTINLVGDALQALNSFTPVQGPFSYGLPCLNPPAAFNVYAGDTFLPILKVPNAIYIADVTP